MMIKAQLIDLGKNKINRTVEVKNVDQLHSEIAKHILSINWEMEESETEGLYTVYAGFRNIGQVQILES